MTYVPPAPDVLRPLDLAQPKEIDGLVTSAWRIWRARPGIFLASSALIAFVPLALIGVVAVALGYRDEPGGGNGFEVVSLLLQYTVIAWLLSAVHARAVVALAAGEDLTLREALTRGRLALGAVAIAAVIAFAVTIAGLLLFVVGAIWIGNLVAFAAPIAAVTETRGLQAVRASRDLVSDAGWWRTFLSIFVFGIVGVIPFAVAFVPLLVAAVIFSSVVGDVNAIGDYVFAVGIAAVEAAVMSWTVLATTMLFFSQCAHIGRPWEVPPGAGPAVDLVAPAVATGSTIFRRPSAAPVPLPGEAPPRFTPPPSA